MPHVLGSFPGALRHEHLNGTTPERLLPCRPLVLLRRAAITSAGPRAYHARATLTAAGAPRHAARDTRLRTSRTITVWYRYFDEVLDEGNAQGCR